MKINYKSHALGETRELFPKTLSRLLADTVKKRNIKKLLSSTTINQERKTSSYHLMLRRNDADACKKDNRSKWMRYLTIEF